MTIKRYDIHDDGVYVSMEPRETGRFVKHDDHIAALRRECEPVEIDIQHSMMDQIEAAASESPWVPPEYYMNEVVYDLCAYLRNPRVDAHALAAERKLSDDLAEAVEGAFFAGFLEGQDGTWVEGDPAPAWKKSEAYAVFTTHAARRKGQQG